MSTFCKKLLASLFFTITLLCFMITGILVLKKSSFTEGKCDISNVTYTQSMGDLDHLVSCSCGKHKSCMVGTCIKIKGKIKSTNEVRMFIPDTDYNVGKSNSKCTFSEKRCKDGLDSNNRNTQLRNNKIEAQKYIWYQKNDSPITCFHRKGDVYLYLKNTDSNTEFYVASGFFLVAILVMCGCFCKCSSCHKKEESDKKSSVDFI